MIEIKLSNNDSMKMESISLDQIFNALNDGCKYIYSPFDNLLIVTKEIVYVRQIEWNEIRWQEE